MRSGKLSKNTTDKIDYFIWLCKILFDKPDRYKMTSQNIEKIAVIFATDVGYSKHIESDEVLL